MVAYRVAFTRRAERQFEALPAQVKRRLAARIDHLQAEPRPRGAVLLSGRERIHRLRIGPYRVLYQVDDERGVVLVLAIAHRREVYRRT